MPDVTRLAVSNIAWEPHEDDAVAEVLRREGVAGVEIAPTKWRPTPYDATPEDIADFRRSWEARGLQIVSLQSLLFGRSDLQQSARLEGRRPRQHGDHVEADVPSHYNFGR